MPKSQAHFENQRDVISQHIESANRFILVAMAWFTDKLLFEQLVRKALAGIQVQVLIHDDVINSTANIDFGRLNGKNCELYIITDSKRTLHHKFCVIDCYTVLHGSYNWTYQAINNHENLTVSEGDISFAATFIAQFFKLKDSYNEKTAPENYSGEEIQKVSNRTRATRRRNRENSEIVASIRAKIEEDKKRAAVNQLNANLGKPKSNTSDHTSP